MVELEHLLSVPSELRSPAVSVLGRCRNQKSQVQDQRGQNSSGGFRSPKTGNAANPNEKMGVLKDPLPSHAPVATCYAPEVPAQPPSSAPSVKTRRTPEFVIHDVPPIEDPSQWIIRSPAVTKSRAL